MTFNIPLPGHKDAIKNGCTCSALENHNGKGTGVGYESGNLEYIIDSKCPLHGIIKPLSDIDASH